VTEVQVLQFNLKIKCRRQHCSSKAWPDKITSKRNSSPAVNPLVLKSTEFEATQRIRTETVDQFVALLRKQNRLGCLNVTLHAREISQALKYM
jgi:hypothetical protein